MFLDVDLASATVAALQMASAVLTESGDEGRMHPYVDGWLAGLIEDLEDCGLAISELADPNHHRHRR